MTPAINPAARNAPISALELPAPVYDLICDLLRKHGGIDCSVWTFMNAEPAKLMFQGCHVIRREL